LSLDASQDDQDIDDWFVEEILPLEPMLMRFFRGHWRDGDEIADLRQETYARIYEAARRKRPSPVKPFVFFVARNLIIDKLRRKNVVPIETMTDTDWLNVSDLEPMPEQRVAARQELRRMQAALDNLPPRCRQVIVLRRVYGFSQREVALKMGIKEETVESQTIKGMRILVDALSDRRGALTLGARRFLMRKD
jgi:RNA polymerase sigma-70 factor (ECF subfamily)